MNELLNNGWVVGIGGGVASGLIVAWLTHLFFSNKNSKEISLNISSANREILYALRPEISEETTPSSEVITALRNATARKYKIESQRLFTITEIGEELIKEIMDSSFISSEKKHSYCDMLKDLKGEVISYSETTLSNAVFNARLEYRERMTHLLSLTFGLIAAFATLFFTVQNIFKSDTLVGQLMHSIFPMISVMGVFMLVITAMQVAFKLRYRRIKAERGVTHTDVKDQN